MWPICRNIICIAWDDIFFEGSYAYTFACKFRSIESIQVCLYPVMIGTHNRVIVLIIQFNNSAVDRIFPSEGGFCLFVCLFEIMGRFYVRLPDGGFKVCVWT